MQSPGLNGGYWRTDWWSIARSVLDDPQYQVTLFADFDPALGGTLGLVVLDWVGPDPGHPEQGERHVVAAWVQAYLEGVLAAMQSGALVFRDGKGVGWNR